MRANHIVGFWWISDPQGDFAYLTVDHVFSLVWDLAAEAFCVIGKANACGFSRSSAGSFDYVPQLWPN